GRTSPRTRGSARRAPARRRLPARLRIARRASSHRSPDARRALPSSRRPRGRPRPRGPGRAGRRAPRGARPSACGLRRAPRAPRRSASAVGRARVRGDEQRDVVVAFAELQLELDAAKEGRGWAEDDAVGAGAAVGKLADAPVAVGLARADELLTAPELDPY